MIDANMPFSVTLEDFSARICFCAGMRFDGNRCAKTIAGKPLPYKQFEACYASYIANQSKIRYLLPANIKVKGESKMRKRAVAVIFGGASAEYGVSLQAARTVINAAGKNRCDLVMRGVDLAEEWYNVQLMGASGTNSNKLSTSFQKNLTSDTKAIIITPAPCESRADNWVWRSLVACLNGVQEAGGSNPLTQTTRESLKRSCFEDFCFEKKDGISAARTEMCHFFKTSVSFFVQKAFEGRRFARLWQPLKCGSVKTRNGLTNSERF